MTPEIPFAPAGDPLANLSEKLAMAHIAAASAAASTPQKTAASNAAGSSPSTSSTSPLQPSGAGAVAGRRLSYLTPIDIATSAVSTADQGLRGIGSTLETSYKFLFGKMEKRGEEVPKTLEDARKLVDSPTIGGLEEQQERSATPTAAAPAMDGLKRIESTASIGSSKSDKSGANHSGGGHKGPTTPAAVETVMNLGSSLGRFAVRGFTRSSTPTTPTANTNAMKGLGISGGESAVKGHKREDSVPVADLLSVCFPFFLRKFTDILM
jgi:hypothetical protein